MVLEPALQLPERAQLGIAKNSEGEIAAAGVTAVSTTGHSNGPQQSASNAEGRMEVQLDYQYKTLKAGEIRTLWLEPGSLGQPLYGWLRCVPLSSDQIILDDDEQSCQDWLDDGMGPDTMVHTDHIEEEDDDLSEDSSTTSWDGPSLAGYDYCAISYAWGSSELTNTITIDDDYVVRITKSLYEALTYLRDDERCRAFWADALCINQGDLAEKSTQVGMMGQIYAHAFSVSIWLGIGSGLDALAFCLLSTISASDYGQRPEWENSEENMAQELVRRLPDHDCTCCRVFKATDPRSAYEQALLGIKDLCCRSWFGRLWVAQEIALAPSDLWLHSGSHEISFARLETFVNFSTEQASQRPLLTRAITTRNLDRVANMANIRLNAIGPSKPDFIDVLLQTSNLDCTNPLDRIYAISALCTTFLEATDYSASLPEVFGNVTKGFLGAEHSRGSVLTPHNTTSLLTIVPITRAISAHGEDWPSWVPDYNNIDARCEWKLTAHRPSRGSVLVRSTDDVNHICMAGRQGGRVRSILFNSDMRHSSGLGLTDFFTTFEVREKADTVMFDTWAQRCALYLERHRDALTTQLELLRSTSDCTSDDTAPCLLDNELNGLQDAHCNDEPHLAFSILRLLTQGTSRSKQHVLALLCSKQSTVLLATIDPDHLLAAIDTSLGTLVGWVPPSTAVDDHVCILHDQPETLVVRGASHLGGWNLIGDTFIPGLTPYEDVNADHIDYDWITFC